MSRTTFYVLALADGKKYVGTSPDPEKAFIEHKEGGLSAWTDLYKPERIEAIHIVSSHTILDQCVVSYMIRYGIQNVRGGSWNTVELTKLQERDLTARVNRERKASCSIQ
jgi:hypothetical protein